MKPTLKDSINYLHDAGVLDQELGKLINNYRRVILEAYAYSEALKRLGYERPWVTSPSERVMIAGPTEVTSFDVEVNKRLRLEIR